MIKSTCCGNVHGPQVRRRTLGARHELTLVAVALYKKLLHRRQEMEEGSADVAGICDGGEEEVEVDAGSEMPPSILGEPQPEPAPAPVLAPAPAPASVPTRVPRIPLPSC